MRDKQLEGRLSYVAAGHQVLTLFIKGELHPVLLVVSVAMNGDPLKDRIREDKGTQSHVVKD